MKKSIIYLWTLMCLPAFVRAEDSGILKDRPAITVMETIKITGNQEQPRLLYLLPWQKAGDMEGLDAQPSHDLDRGDIDFIERKHFQRVAFLKQKLLRDGLVSASALKSASLY